MQQPSETTRTSQSMFRRFWDDENIRRYWTTVWVVFLFALAVFGIVENFVILPIGLGVSFTTYGLITSAHTILQFIRAGINEIKVRYTRRKADRERFTFPFAVLSFGHEEDPRYYRLHIRSIVAMPKTQRRGVIFMADDTTRDNYEMMKIFSEEVPSAEGFYLNIAEIHTGIYSSWPDEYKEYLISQIRKLKPRVHYIFLMQPKGGKRKIMYTAIQVAIKLWPGIQGVGLTDSDTVIEPHAYDELAKIFVNKNVGAVSGFVGILNKTKSFLARVSSDRYWRAFNWERAAQSASGSVICVSGPLGMYRLSALLQILEEWYTATFLGVERTYGDDREFTNKVMGRATNPATGRGYEIWYTHFARCLTETPETIERWVLQQTRWMKSSNREAIDSFRQIKHVAHWAWYTYELVFQQALSMLLLVGIVYQFVQVLRHLVPLLIIHQFAFLPILACFLPIVSLLIAVALGGFLRGLAGFMVGVIGRSPDKWERFLSVVYGYYFMLFLLKARIHALLAIYDDSWGTSSRAQLARVSETESDSLEP